MLTNYQKSEINEYIFAGKNVDDIKKIMNIHGRCIADYVYYQRKTSRLPKKDEVYGSKREIKYTFKIGEKIIVKEGKKENEYNVESIPSHHRFIVCRRVLKGKPTNIVQTFDSFELAHQLVT